MQDLVMHAWRSLRETDAVLGDLPVVPPLEDFHDVTTAARMALHVDSLRTMADDQLAFDWD